MLAHCCSACRRLTSVTDRGAGRLCCDHMCSAGCMLCCAAETCMQLGMFFLQGRMQWADMAECVGCFVLIGCVCVCVCDVVLKHTHGVSSRGCKLTAPHASTHGLHSCSVAHFLSHMHFGALSIKRLLVLMQNEAPWHTTDCCGMQRVTDLVDSVWHFLFVAGLWLLRPCCLQIVASRALLYCRRTQSTRL